MANADVIRAWKDEEYRQGLDGAELAQLPAHPAGLIELTDADLIGVDGGTTSVACSITASISLFSATVSCWSCGCP